MPPPYSPNRGSPSWAATGLLGAVVGLVVLVLEALAADLGRAISVAGVPALAVSAGLALGGGVAMVVVGVAAWRGWERLREQGPAVPVVAVAALVVGVVLVSDELFTGPQARELPLVATYPWLLGLITAASVAGFARVARARPRFAAGIAAAIAVVAFVLDAWVHKGRYPAFHLLLFLVTGTGLVTASVLPQWPLPRASLRASRALLVLLPVGAAVSLAVLSRAEGLRAELIVRTVHLARAAEIVPTVDLGVDDGVDVPFRWPDTFNAAMTAHQRVVDGLPKTKLPILFVTVDALRADRGPGGERAGDVMPKLEAWSRRGVRFLRAYAPSVTTWISARSIMSGRYPESFLARTPPPVRVLPAELKRLGYRTFIWSGYPIMDRQSNKWLPALADAFEEQVQHYTMRRILQRAEIIRDRTATTPWFQWLHIMEVHGPYRPKKGYERGTSLEELYDGTVAYVDDRLTPLLESVSEDAWVIVAADHGEDMPSEHGFSGHGSGLYEPAIRVPLVIRGPGIVPRDITEPVSLVDLFSTLLGMAGDSRPPPSDGLSLLPALFGDAPYLAERDIIHIDHRFVTNTELRHNPMRAVVTRDGKAIIQDGAGVLEAFDLEDDPKEIRNLLVSDPARARALRSHLIRHTEARRAWWDSLGGSSGFSGGEMVDRLRRAAQDGKAAVLRGLLRSVAVESGDSTLRGVLTDISGGDDPVAAAWAAVALGRLPGPWPCELALAGPDDDARSMALDLLIAQPPGGGRAASVAELLLARVDQDAPSKTYKEVAALNRMGDRRGLVLLERMLIRQTYGHGVAEVLRHQPRRLRPELPMVLDRSGDHVARSLSAVGSVAHHAPGMPGRFITRVLRRIRETHGSLRFEGATVAQMADDLIATIASKAAEERQRLNAVEDGDPWRADLFSVAWGIVDGVNLVMSDLGPDWRPVHKIVTLRRMTGPRATIPIDAAAKDRRGLLEVVSRRGRLRIRSGGRLLLDIELREGPQTRTFTVPAGCTGLDVELAEVSSDDIGFRELLLL